MQRRTYISFDWAIKKLLRQKDNFDILEGFLSEFLGFDVLIQEILESEANKNDKYDKFDRVDILVKSTKDELILIELQYDSELALDIIIKSTGLTREEIANNYVIKSKSLIACKIPEIAP